MYIAILITKTNKLNKYTYNSYLNISIIISFPSAGISPELNKFVPGSTEDLLEWSFIARSLYSATSANPKQKIDSAMREGLEDVITEVMENINNYSRQRGRVIEFRELLYGYHRLDALHGQDLILDLLLIYKKYRGKKMTVPVRRHLYVQRAFTGIFVKEFDEDFYNVTLQQSESISSRYYYVPYLFI